MSQSLWWASTDPGVSLNGSMMNILMQLRGEPTWLQGRMGLYGSRWASNVSRGEPQKLQISLHDYGGKSPQLSGWAFTASWWASVLWGWASTARRMGLYDSGKPPPLQGTSPHSSLESRHGSMGKTPWLQDESTQPPGRTFTALGGAFTQSRVSLHGYGGELPRLHWLAFKTLEWTFTASNWASAAPGWASASPRWASRAPGWTSTTPGWTDTTPWWASTTPGWPSTISVPSFRYENKTAF